MTLMGKAKYLSYKGHAGDTAPETDKLREERETTEHFFAWCVVVVVNRIWGS